MGSTIHTYSEAKLDCSAALLSLTNNIASSRINIEDIGECMPGGVMVQNLSAELNTYMNDYGCSYLKHDCQELRDMGALYFKKFFPAEEMITLKAELYQFISLDDYSTVRSFFQRVRPDSDSAYKWFLTTSRLYKPIGGVDAHLMNIAIEVNTIKCAGHKISNIFDNDSYIKIHYQKFCSLTKREKEIIKLIGNDHSSYVIADMLNLSIHTVNNHRKNIASKLHITSFSQLIKFAVAFNLI